MKKKVVKKPKIALCRNCGGTGYRLSEGGEKSACPLCNGSGRVMVSAEMEIDIRAYRDYQHRDR